MSWSDVPGLDAILIKPRLNPQLPRSRLHFDLHMLTVIHKDLSRTHRT